MNTPIILVQNPSRIKPKMSSWSYIMIAFAAISCLFATHFQVLWNNAGYQKGSLQSLSHIKQIGIALMMYTQDYDEVLPPMQSTKQLKPFLYPYLKSNSVWLLPYYDNVSYAINPKLSQKSLAEFESPSETIWLYEPFAPYNNEIRAVSFLDGHAKGVQKSTWSNWEAEGKMPLPANFHMPRRKMMPSEYYMNLATIAVVCVNIFTLLASSLRRRTANIGMSKTAFALDTLWTYLYWTLLFFLLGFTLHILSLFLGITRTH
jgi:hypothetical protein